MTSLSDVAREVGCSASLVSKVLRGRMGKSSARPEKVRKILETAHRLGYTPNATARALVRGRHNAIAVFLPRWHGQPGSGLDAAVISAIAEELTALGQRLMLQFFLTPDELADALANANPGTVDGILAVLQQTQDIPNLAHQLEASPLPVVTLYDEPVSARLPNIGLDQHDVGSCAAHALLAAGCTAPVFLDSGDAISQRRLSGFRDALAESGRTLRTEHIWSLGGYDPAALPPRLLRALDAQPDWDGLAAPSDPLAFSALQTLRERGIRVPEQIQIVGTDDGPLCGYTQPMLSSVSGQDAARSRLGIQTLQRLIAGESVGHTRLTPQFIARGTTRTQSPETPDIRS